MQNLVTAILDGLEDVYRFGDASVIHSDFKWQAGCVAGVCVIYTESISNFQKKLAYLFVSFENN